MKYYHIILFLAFLLLNTACADKKHPVNFYYWKSKVSIEETEKKYFNELESNKLYIRFFDIDTDGTSINPKAKISLFDPTILDAEYIPVIYITNRTFFEMSDNENERLASKVYNLIDQICTKNSISQIHEIQIDCDWTQKTKDTYFAFLKNIKKISDKNISCTIRLHQIKYKESTGVPPVDKGYLMCYATSDPTNSDEKNSILDIPLLKDYTATINSFPLKFDIALPLYSWGIITNHLGQIKLINNVSQDSLNTSFFKKIDNNLYEVQDDFFFQGIYVNKGFRLKIETISPQLLDEAKQYLDKKIDQDYSIVYYHLDKEFLRHFTIAELQ